MYLISVYFDDTTTLKIQQYIDQIAKKTGTVDRTLRTKNYEIKFWDCTVGFGRHLFSTCDIFNACIESIFTYIILRTL